MKIAAFFSRASVPGFRSENPICKTVSFLSLLTSVLVAQAISAAADGIVYKVRLENGVDQYYLLDVPPNIPPVTLNPHDWNQPWYATDHIGQNAAVLAAVAWAGGTEDHDPGYSNSLTNVGGKVPGGFYHAIYIKVGDVEYRPSPVPNYLVHLNGQIGQTRQSFYACVLEDGRIVRPTPVAAPEAHHYREPKYNPSESWGGSGEKMTSPQH